MSTWDASRNAYIGPGGHPPAFDRAMNRYSGDSGGIAVWDMPANRYRSTSDFSPSDLDGLLISIDVSDLSTMFQDIAGTVPVSAIGDPVGRVLDTSGNGLHFIAPSDGARPIYSRRSRNFVKSSGDFSAWPRTGVSVTSVDNGFKRVESLGGVAYPRVERNDIAGNYGTYTFQVEVREGTSGAVVLRAVGDDFGGIGENSSAYSFDFSSLSFSKIGGADAEELPSFSEISAGVYLISITFTTNIVGGINIYPVWNDASAGLSVDVRNPQLTIGPKASPYHETNAAGISDDASSDVHWIEFDGVNDVLATSGKVPFSAEIFTCAAFRLDTFNSQFPNFFVNSGSHVGDGNRHPLIYSRESSKSMVVVDIEGAVAQVDTFRSILGRDIISTSGFDGASVHANADGISVSHPGIPPKDLNTDPAAISGGNRFDGRFYGVVHASATPSVEQVAELREWFSKKTNGVA